MIKYSNSDYSVVIDEEKCETVNLEISGKKVLGEKKLPLFDIQLRLPDGDTEKVSGYDGRLTECKRNGNEYTLTYGGFDKADITVTVKVKLGKDIRWRIDVKSSEAKVIEWIEFPKMTVVNDLPYMGGKAKLLWGYNEGAIVEDLSAKERHLGCKSRGFEYPQEGSVPIFPGITETQFTAYISEGFGLYMGAHDAACNMKGIDFISLGDSVYMQFRLFTGLDFGDSFIMDYDFVTAPFFGDWYAAADIYRSFFEKNNKGFLKIKENGKLPDWYGKSPIVVTYPVRGTHDTDEMTPNKMFPYIEGLKHIEKIAKKTDSCVLVILMHWEGTAPWAPPFVWPPYGGEEALKEYADALHKSGNFIGLYCSGLGYTVKSRLIKSYNKEKEFEDKKLSRFMCVSPKGELPLSKICNAQRSGYDLCPSCEFTAEALCGELENMVKADIDYVQILDQNHGGTPYFCYSREHGHPPVPGKWQKEAMLSLFERFEKIIKESGRKVLLGCESAAAEPYISYLLFNDNRFNLNYRIGSYAVPLYAYIFHEYINNYMGNQVAAHGPFKMEKYPGNLIMRIAYSFAAGDLITLVINQEGQVMWNWGFTEESLPVQENVYKYIENANAVRKGIGRKYLQNGKMQAPFKVLTEDENVIELEEGYVCRFPKVFTSAWTAEDGSFGQIITNYNAESVDIKTETEKDTVIRLNEEENVIYKRGETFTLKAFQTVLLEEI